MARMQPDLHRHIMNDEPMTLKRFPSHYCTLFGRKLSTSCNHLKAPWRVLFLGTDDYSLPHFDALNKNRLSSASAVSQIDAMVTTHKCPVYKYAQKNNIKTTLWPVSNEEIKDCYDVGVIVSFGRLIPESFIQMFPRGILNVHPSLLPKWRGAAPIPHTILNGDQKTAVSIMEISPHRFDVGPLLAQNIYTIPQRATTYTLQNDLANIGSKLLIYCLENLDSIPKKEQDKTIDPGPPAKKFAVKHSFINWKDQTIDDVDRQFRAISNMLDLRSIYAGIHVRLKQMVEPKDFPADFLEKLSREPSVPGQPIYNSREEILCIKCKDGWTAFKEINIKKPMTAKSFYNGYLSKKQNENLIFESVKNGLESYFRVSCKR